MAIGTSSVFPAYRQAGCQITKEKEIIDVIAINYVNYITPIANL
jgi:hypothetical protein